MLTVSFQFGKKKKKELEGMTGHPWNVNAIRSMCIAGQEPPISVFDHTCLKMCLCVFSIFFFWVPGYQRLGQVSHFTVSLTRTTNSYVVILEVEWMDGALIYPRAPLQNLSHSTCFCTSHQKLTEKEETHSCSQTDKNLLSLTLSFRSMDGFGND